jgi:hypothetical protein
MRYSQEESIGSIPKVVSTFGPEALGLLPAHGPKRPLRKLQRLRSDPEAYLQTVGDALWRDQ